MKRCLNHLERRLVRLEAKAQNISSNSSKIAGSTKHRLRNKAQRLAEHSKRARTTSDRTWFTRSHGSILSSEPAENENKAFEDDGALDPRQPFLLSEVPDELVDLRTFVQKLCRIDPRLYRQGNVHINMQGTPRRMGISHSGRVAGDNDKQRASHESQSLRSQIHSVNEAFDNGLATLAQQSFQCLARLRRECDILMEPEPEPEPEGYVSLPKDNSCHFMTAQRTKTVVPVAIRRLAEISALPPSYQNMHYETVLTRTTTSSEVLEQYEKHLCRLDDLRAEIARREEPSREDRAVGRRSYDLWTRHVLRAMLNKPVSVEIVRIGLQTAFDRGQKSWQTRIHDKVAEGGIMRLLERCESILKLVYPRFRPNVWTRDFKGRWNDAKPGWTGLDVEDVSLEHQGLRLPWKRRNPFY